ncbi:glycosyl transferase family 2 [Burkholderia sp. SRS-46]|nr:glycosyl transferase family 2 [Burkholderia sp. SRS-46]
MKLSIIIPAYNEEAYLGTCLRSASAELRANAGRGPFEIIVVDNASTDRTAAIAAGFPNARVVSAPHKGLTHARQRGLEEATGEILAYIDADTQMPPGWIQRVLETYDRGNQIVCVSGPYIYDDLSRTKHALVRLYWLLLAKPTYRLTRYMAVGGNFAARKEALLRVGGFDTSIAFYGEDTDIARRLFKVGEVIFDMGLVMRTSARRLNTEGFFRTALRYAMNFVSEAAFKRPATTEYRDIR